ncbi:uncharacterized protein [Hetaerina americana]|uniref:uncharacterized protein n=1 Tax=Hetaerina americana TaxID=62018 RepID=UPI003A7F6281
MSPSYECQTLSKALDRSRKMPKVKRACGQARWTTSDEEDLAARTAHGGDGAKRRPGKKGARGGKGGEWWEEGGAKGGPKGEQQSVTEGVVGKVANEDTIIEEKLDTVLRRFLSGLLRSRGFYGTLAETLCSDEGFAETGETAACWNGQRVGEYTKTVVASSLSAQKYNPEVSWTALHRAQDPEIARLSDRLRHVRQVLLSQLTSNPESASLVLEGHGGSGGSGGRDELEEEEEGSGSGHRPMTHWNDDEDANVDGWNIQGSGSGEPPYERPGVTNPDSANPKEKTSVKTTSGASVPSLLPVLVTFVAFTLVILPKHILAPAE